MNQIEQHRLLREWNDSHRPFPSEHTLDELFAAQAAARPETIALEHGDEHLSYRELDRRVERLARRLGAGPEAVVGFCLEPSIRRTIAQLAIVKSGAAYLPLDRAYPAERLALLIEDAGCRLVLTETATIDALWALEGRRGLALFNLDTALDLDTEPGMDLEPEAALCVSLSPDNAVYVIYTSGSTGKPKGVVVVHRAVARLVLESDYAPFGAGLRMAQAANVAFDASTFELWGALLHGGCLVTVEKERLLDPERLAQIIAERRLDQLFLTPAVFSQVARERPTAFAPLAALVLGGEALPPERARAVLAAGPPGRLVNGYGPTETTTFAVCHRVSAVSADASSVPIGRPIANTTLYVVDRGRRLLPAGAEGELTIGGPGLARGYLARPGLTAERFIPDPWGPAGSRLYLSGDRVRYDGDGTLEFLGRFDHQVKVRGFRIELGEVETRLAEHPRVGEGVVLVRGESAEERHLVGYVAPAPGGSKPTPAELHAHLAARLPAYMMPSAIVVLDRFPLNASGKVDRKALPAPAAETPATLAMAPRSELETALAAILGQLLGVGQLGVDDDFFTLGAHSLLIAQLTARARSELRLEIPLAAVFEAPTVRALAARVEAAAGEPPPPIERAPRDRPIPLSFAQERVWFLTQLSPGLLAYNVQLTVRLHGRLRPAVLARALTEIVRRHEVLRTTFPAQGGEPVQVIHPPFAVALPYVDLTGLPAAERERAARRAIARALGQPFEVTRLPLVRWSLFALGSQEHLLLQIEHHFVHDGWSIALLLREIQELYPAFDAGRPSPLPELPVQYADFAVWQRRWLSGEVLRRQLEFWKQHIGAHPPRLELPTDRPRPAARSFRGDALQPELPAGLYAELRQSARRQGVSLFVFTLTAFEVLLARHAGQEEIVLASGFANRRLREIETMIGMVVNTVVLRFDLRGEPSWRAALARTRAVLLAAHTHQDTPLERLVAELQPERRLGESPLFQVMFSFHDSPVPDLDFGGLHGELRLLHNRTAKADLNVVGIPRAEQRLGRGARADDAEMRFIWELDRDLFDRTTIERWWRHYQVVLADAAAHPERSCFELALFSPEERHQLLVEWSQPGWGPAPAVDVMARVAGWAVETPETAAVVAGGTRLGYGELAARSRALARQLEQLGIGPGSRVGVLFEPSAEMVVAMLGTLEAGAAYVALDPAWPAERLAFVLEDAAPAVLLTHVPALGRLPAGLAAEAIVLDDQGSGGGEPTAPASLPPAAALAYVIYTSGSTGRPKGVEITRGGLAHLVAWHLARHPLAPRTATSQVAGLGFDASVWEVWSALGAGASLHVVPAELRADPPRLLGWLAEHAVAAAFLPTPLAEAVLAEPWPTGMKLGRLLTGGDRLHRVDRPLPLELFNCYGPTETTVVTTCGRVVPAAALPSIGRPIDGARALLLDRRLRPVPIGVAGELWAGGAGLARGYLRRPGLTAERFCPDPFRTEPGSRLYRSGDLARTLANGEIDFLGRVDHQVKIRGLRIELGEVEAVLREQPGVREAVVMALADPGETRLAAWVAAEGTSAETLEQALRHRLPAAMVPASWVLLAALPRNPSGKVDRAALPAPEPAREREHTPPRTPIEEILAGIWAAVLGARSGPIGVFDDFFELGGHSLAATQVVSRIERALGAELSVAALFETRTIAGLAERIAAAKQRTTPEAIALARGPRPAELPLSFAQERLWFLDRLAPDNPFYNVPVSLRITGALDPAALAASLTEIVRRHEVLRTALADPGGRPCQQIAPPFELALPRIDLRRLGAATADRRAREIAARELRRPFELARGPLVRSLWVDLADQQTALLLTLHHAVADGWSIGVLLGELAALYGAAVAGRSSPLPELVLQYADFALWQRAWLAGSVLDRQLGYWRRQLAGAQLLELPTDRPRPVLQSFHGRRVSFELDPAQTAALERLAGTRGATPFMTLLAAVAALLYRITGQDDVVVGTPIANRNRAEIEGLIGFFVNSLALRTRLVGDPGFGELVERVRAVALGAYEHQDLPFELLVEHLHPERDLTRNPIFQVMSTLQNAPAPPVEMAGLRLEPMAVEVVTTHFDLEINFWPRSQAIDAGLRVVIAYDRDLFDRTTLLRLARQLERLTLAAVTDPTRRIGDLPLLAAGERHQLVAELNDAHAEYPREPGLAELFERQVRRDPTAEAVVSDDLRLSYGELDRLANRLAHRLIALGVGPESLVALAMERGATLVCALLGVLKAGGAYLPLDPAYPVDRLAFMLDDARPQVLVCDREPPAGLMRPGLPVLVLDSAGGLVEGGGTAADAAPPARADGRHLAYVLYTSGSTGKPKAVLIEQRSVARLVLGSNYLQLEPRHRIAQVSNTSFDAATFELWGALLTGAALVGIATDVLLTPRLLERELRREAITTLSLTMGPFHLAAREHPETFAPLEHLLFGAEAADPRLVRAVRLATGARMVHLYGPTESTSFATWQPVESRWFEQVEEGRALPIGRPLANTEALLFDRRLRLVPLGAVGEVYLGGDGLARGYLRRPATTAERFVPNPRPARQAAGARLYRTGDLARRLAGGEIVFAGRTDHQVKIRGFRIEPGEVEAVLTDHPEVTQAVVQARTMGEEAPRLVAWVVAADTAAAGTGAERQLWEEAQVDTWRQLFEDAYTAPPAETDPTFNVIGWRRTGSGEPIPADEMREWLADTVAGIQALAPRRVLEIGCGTGLVLYRVAPRCELYVGTELSLAAIAAIEGQRATLGLPQVQLRRRPAHDFSDFAPAAFDLVVLNSVVQYFPSAEYLAAVIERALLHLAPDGAIFLGDVRSLPLAELFQTTVALEQASEEVTREELRHRIGTALHEEDELLVDPAFFFALAERLPRITGVEIRPKRGHCHNELTGFRYQVVLSTAPPPPRAEAPWLDWQSTGLGLETLRRKLRTEAPATLALTAIPNARLSGAVAARERLYAEGASLTAGELRREVAAHAAEIAIDPQALWDLETELPYDVTLSWAGHGREGRYHAFLRRRAGPALAPPPPPLPPVDLGRPWSAFATRPLRGRLARRLVPELRTQVSQRLPEHMMPASFVLLDALPLTPNGKLDRAALPLPELAPLEGRAGLVAPRSEEERVLASIWAGVLGITAPIGIHDDFFELGGHSLAATQVVSQVRERLGVELPLRELFAAPTIAGLTAHLAAAVRESRRPPLLPLPRPAELPLSFAQQRLWFLDRLTPGNPFYNFPITLYLRGALDPAALAASLGEIVRRHEVLRTRFEESTGSARQVIDGEPPRRLPVVDLGRLAPGARGAEARRLHTEEAARPFDLARGPVWRQLLLSLGPGEGMLLVTLHHIAADGWSLGVLLRELEALYTAARAARPGQTVASPLPELAVQSADFALWQRRWLAGAELERQLAYWQRELEGAAQLELPTDRPRPRVQTFRGRRAELEMGAELTVGVRELGRRTGATLFMTTFACFAALLHRLSGQGDLVIGSVVANRSHPALEPMIGFFVNTLPLRSRPSPADPTFETFLRRTTETTLGALAHQDVPFEKLVEHLELRRELDRNPLFQVVFALQSAPRAGFEMAGCEVTTLSSEARSTRFDLEIHLWEREQGLRAVWIWDRDLFDPTTIQRWAYRLASVLASAAGGPWRALSELALLAPADRHQLLAEWNDTRSTYPRTAGLAELTARRAGGQPAAEAVVGLHADGRREALTWAELSSLAHRLAHRLRRRGVRRGDLVGVEMERGAGMIVAFLGILESGAAYLPLDPAQPPERRAAMIEDARPRVVLAAGDVAAEALAIELAAAPPHVATGDDLAYVIYTSGSTGKPKGVAVTQRAVARLVLETNYLELRGDDRIAQVSNSSFDAATFEIWGALLHGASLVIIPNETLLSPRELERALAEEKISILSITMVLFNQVARERPETFSGLRALLFGAEAADARHVRTVRERFSGRLVHLYGPTECTGFATWHRVRELPAGLVSLPIGRPLANTEALVVDRWGTPATPSAIGELLLGGDGLASGYLGRPAATAERFVPHPFAIEPGARLYRTGDLARRLASGELVFAGRVDHQVKIRGFRVEPGEIEAVLGEHPAVAAVAVVVLGAEGGETGERWLAAGVVARVAPIDLGALRDFARARLLEAMVPAVFFELEALPLNPNGKLDRVALGRIAIAERAGRARTGGGAPPSTPTELRLAELWSELLGTERIGREDDFFELGGHSLAAMQVIAGVRAAFGVELPLRSLFESPTLAGFARWIEGAGALARGAATPADEEGEDLEEVVI